MVHVLTQALFAAIACFGFCIIYRVPRKCMLACSIVGGISWGSYELVIWGAFDDPVIAAFFAAFIVGICADICARVFKKAATIFTIPGIIPLVPGSYIFYTMRSLLDSDFASTGTYATDTFKLAAAIALGLLVEGSLAKIVLSIYHKTTGVIKNQFYRF